MIIHEHRLSLIFFLILLTRMCYHIVILCYKGEKVKCLSIVGLSLYNKGFKKNIILEGPRGRGALKGSLGGGVPPRPSNLDPI